MPKSFCLGKLHDWNGLGGVGLELMRAAVNHALREKMLDRSVTFWIPEASTPRDRWLTRSEAAEMLWRAWRHRREDRSPLPWPDLNQALAMRAAGQSHAVIAEKLGLSRSQVLGRLRGHDVRVANKAGSLRMSKHVARFILICLYTGKRKTAALSGAFSRVPGYGYIDLDEGVWHPPIGKRRTKKRQPAQPLPSNLVAHMRRWERNGQQFAIEYQDEPIDRLDKSFRALVRDCGFEDVVIHTLRHTAITWGLQRGMDIWDAAGYFGVSVEVLSQVYGHHSPHHLRNAAELMRARPKLQVVKRASA